MQFDRHQLTEAFNLSVREINVMHAAGLPRAQDNGSGTAIYDAHDVMNWAIMNKETRLLDIAGWAEVLQPPPGAADEVVRGILQGRLPPDLSSIELQGYARLAEIFAKAQIAEQQRARQAGELIDRQVLVRALEQMYEVANMSINEFFFERIDRTAKAAFDIYDETNRDVQIAVREEMIPILQEMATVLDAHRGVA